MVKFIQWVKIQWYKPSSLSLSLSLSLLILLRSQLQNKKTKVGPNFRYILAHSHFFCHCQGQLGYFQSKIQQQPKRIDAFKGVKIISVVTGSNHNLAIDGHCTSQFVSDEMRKLFCFVLVQNVENDTFYQNMEQCMCGVSITMDKQDKVTQILFGNQNRSLRLTVFFNETRDNSQSTHQSNNIRLGSVWLIHSCFQGHKVMKVAAGLYHSLLLTTTGELYGMGSNKQGQLGLGERIR
jgi:alpha-tubulin suppressor-like RCC1 family protein